MKILLISKEGLGAWFSLRLQAEGHDVDYFLIDKYHINVLSGIAPSVLTEEPNYSKYDLAICDVTNTGYAEKAAQHCPVIGDSELATMLEDDREFGIKAMEDVGINVPPYEVFSDIASARHYIEKTKKAYVFKPFTEGEEQNSEATYVSTSSEDLLKYLDKLGEMSHGSSFLLQQVVHGTEVSMEAYFNGENFYFINCTLEEKKFMNDNKGPNTGCSGNIVWAFGNEPTLFKEGLGKMKDWLCEREFTGMIDLNTIVSTGKLYGLEWTPRFGYDASASIFKLLRGDMGQFFYDIATGAKPVDNPITGEFVAATRLSIPPYPTEEEGLAKAGVPLQGITEREVERDFYLYDAMVNDDGDLVTAGVNGFIGCPISIGENIQDAYAGIIQTLHRVKIPDLQYRTDLAKKIDKRYINLLHNGWFK